MAVAGLILGLLLNTPLLVVAGAAAGVVLVSLIARAAAYAPGAWLTARPMTLGKPGPDE